jgi:hypothetical protein
VLLFFKKLFSHRSSLYFPKYSPVILLSVILLFAYFYNYHEIIKYRPQGVHQWRQCDCLSLTSNFYSGEADFFHPEIHNLLRDDEGRTASEFPLIYYLNALLWKLLGKHEWIFRLINFMISVVAMLALLNVFEHMLKDSFWSIFSVCLLFTSGIFAYYSLNFLMNTPAFSFALMGWYFFFKFYRDGKKGFLYLMFLFFLLGGLLKASSLISFVALSGIFVFEWIGLFPMNRDTKIFRNKLAFIVPSLILVAVIYLWITYVQQYNSKWNAGVFLLGILPVWDMSTEQINEVLDHVFIRWINGYFFWPTQVFFIVALISTWIFWKKAERPLLLLSGLMTIGFVSFILLFFEALKNHDYYVIDLLILAIFIMLSFFTLLLRNRKRLAIIDLTFIKVIAVLFLLLNMSNTSREIKKRYSAVGNIQKNEMYGYLDIEPYLDSLGVDASKKVISASDRTINVSLYLMNRKGWCRYGTNMEDSAAVADRIKRGAEYLLYHQEIDFQKNSHWPHFIQEELGVHENVTVAKIGLPQ